MNKILKGAVVGGAIGVIAPVTMGVANDFLWSLNSDAGPRICFAERLWSLQRIKVVHAKGCRNKSFDSIPFCLLIGVLGGSLISSLSLFTKDTQKQLKDSPAEPASTFTPPAPVAGINPPTAPVEKKLTIPSISLPSISPQINQGVSRLKGLDWNTIAKGTAVAGGILVIGLGAVNLLMVNNGTNQNKQVQFVDFQSIERTPSDWKSIYDQENTDAISRSCRELITNAGAKSMTQGDLQHYLNRGAKLVSKTDWKQNITGAQVMRNGKPVIIPLPPNNPLVVNGICKGYEYILEGSESAFK